MRNPAFWAYKSVNMKALLATLAVAAICASAGWNSSGHASEAEETVEDPAEMRPTLPRGALGCVFEDRNGTEIHVLLCRFEESEDCVLTAPMPLKDMMQKFEAVKIFEISSTPEGCSKVTFSGTLKEPE
jgi:hypothetical protein